MSLSTSIHELRNLVLSFHPVIVIETVEEDRVSELLAATAHELDMPLFDWTLTRGLQRVPGGEAHAAQWTTEPGPLLAHLDKLTVEALFHLKDFGRHLDDPAVVRQFRELAKHFATLRSTLVLTGRNIELPPEIAHHVVHYDLRMPSADELRPVLRNVLRSLQRTRQVDVDLSPEDLDRFLAALSGLTLNQARQAIAHAVIHNGRLDASDVERAQDRKAEILREDGLLEYYPAEDNPYELGGFGRLKCWLERASAGFSAQAREMNLEPPSGILLVGVPGCGKSLAARYVARSWKLPLVKLDAGRLYDKYVGESEKNFRKALALAESMSPVVLWIDEIEKAMAQSGGGDDSGVSRRIFGAFLTWLQEKQEQVFVVATANDLSALPPELLRKGRFDEIFFVDLPDAAEREAIFAIHLRQRKQDPAAVDLSALVEASDGMSGAEIEQAVTSSLYEALHRKQPLDTAMLVCTLESTLPLSVTRREQIEALRREGRERFVPVA